MIRILFICHGNICRSTAAQMIFQDMVDRAGLSDRFLIDSAGTSAEETGNPVYPPMKRALTAMHVPILCHRARQVQRSEYDSWDYIIGMDRENMWNLDRIFRGDPERKVSMLMAWTGQDGAEVDDPWYTGCHAEAARQIEEGCSALLEQILRNKRKTGMC